MPSEVTLQQFDDHPAVMALTLGLPVIATEDVTPASFAIADDNLLGREIVPKPGGAAALAMRQAGSCLPQALANSARLSPEFMPESTMNIARPKFQPRTYARTRAMVLTSHKPTVES